MGCCLLNVVRPFNGFPLHEGRLAPREIDVMMAGEAGDFSLEIGDFPVQHVAFGPATHYR